MKPRLIIVHGIHTGADAQWMDYIGQRFHDAGWCTHKFNYGFAIGLLTRYQNGERARRLAALIKPGDVVLGHSNGGTLTYLAAELGAPIKGAILLNPALDEDRVLAPHVRWVNLYANHYDEAVHFSAVLLHHQWGAQGRNGITADDPRYNVVFTDEGLPPVRGHSDILAPGKIEPWTTRLIQDAEDRL